MHFFIQLRITLLSYNIDKEVYKELPEDDLIEDRNMLECFLKCWNDFNINFTKFYLYQRMHLFLSYTKIT